MSSEGSRLARAEREARHQAQLAEVNKKARNWRRSAICLGIAFSIMVVQNYFDGWNNSAPPNRQKLEVKTFGWHDPKRGWCSYETGEQISVIEWR